MTTEVKPDAAAAAPVAPGAGPLDAEALRADFPILDQEIHGHRLVYLDSASTSQKPLAVIEAMDAYYRGYNANVHRGIYTIGEKATAAYEGARTTVARFIGAPDRREIVFTRNATEAINLVAYSWGRKNIGRGDVIVLTEMEHHANLVPWQLLAQEKDADLEFIPITDGGVLRQDVFDVLLRLKPKLVAFTHASNTLGTINPVEDMTRRAHVAGAMVLIDGAQAVPHLPVNVAEMGADFYVFSGHKMLAPTGSGALWARRVMSSTGLIVPRVFDACVNATSFGLSRSRTSNTSWRRIPSSVIGMNSRSASFSWASSCHGTRLAWCSISVRTMTSPREMFRRPHEYATRLIASVALRVNTISRRSGAPMNRATVVRAPSYAAVAFSPIV